ncbi:MAG: endonuclease/exonuclease/phosphatase family protein [Chitinophagaceae bacterium]|nr:endonuclease/exonuclease/phosphatase family protein [Chitinophagaceae bacterium]
MLPRIRKIIRISFSVANILAILCYFMACLVPFISSGKSWLIAMLGLAFPLLFIVLLGFFTYWLFRRSKWAFVCLASMLLGWQQVSVMFGFHFPKKIQASREPGTLRVMSWNLSMWGQSNTTNKSKPDYETEMIDLIKRTDADVLCFQEYLYFKDSKYRDSIPPALLEKGYRYSYFKQVRYHTRIYQTTILTASVIISKYPITDTGHIFFSEEDLADPLMYADIKFNEQTIRVFTTHLQSVMFEGWHYNAMRNLNGGVKKTYGDSKAIAYRLRNAYIKRSSQAEAVRQKIKESPYPVIICGDFNDVPNSYTYFTLKGNLQDAFLKKGSGFGRTLNFISPTLRIDYILADKKLEIDRFHVIKVPYSDHYPVVADMRFPGDH